MCNDYRPITIVLRTVLKNIRIFSQFSTRGLYYQTQIDNGSIDKPKPIWIPTKHVKLS